MSRHRFTVKNIGQPETVPQKIPEKCNFVLHDKQKRLQFIIKAVLYAACTICKR